MTNLSPTAQAVSDAYFRYALGKEPSFEVDRKALAAALRAAALYCKRDAVTLLAIADELEAQ
jgi:hypothetical protein